MWRRWKHPSMSEDVIAWLEVKIFPLIMYSTETFSRFNCITLSASDIERRVPRLRFSTWYESIKIPVESTRQFQGDRSMKKMVSCESITCQFNTSSPRNHLTSTYVSLKFSIPLITDQSSGLNKIFASTRRDVLLHVKRFHGYTEKEKNHVWRLKDTWRIRKWRVERSSERNRGGYAREGQVGIEKQVGDKSKSKITRRRVRWNERKHERRWKSISG